MAKRKGPLVPEAKDALRTLQHELKTELPRTHQMSALERFKALARQMLERDRVR